jgi:hypothetical protein
MDGRLHGVVIVTLGLLVALLFGSDGVVQRIAAATGQVVATIPIWTPYGPVDVAVHRDAVWAAGPRETHGSVVLHRIDTATNAVVGAALTVPAPVPLVRLGTDGTALWAFSGGPHFREAWLVRIDTARNQVASVIDLGARVHAKSLPATGVAIAAGTMWVARGSVLEKLPVEPDQ